MQDGEPDSGPGSMEELRPHEILRLEAELRRTIEQLLSLDPNGMLRIHQVVAEVSRQRVFETVIH